MATKTFATWALALQFGNLTTPVVDMAVKSIYNWAGCAIGGYALPPTSIALGAMSPFVGTDGNWSIFATGDYVDMKTAALINGIASHADDYDDYAPRYSCSSLWSSDFCSICRDRVVGPRVRPGLLDSIYRRSRSRVQARSFRLSRTLQCWMA